MGAGERRGMDGARLRALVEEYEEFVAYGGRPDAMQARLEELERTLAYEVGPLLAREEALTEGVRTMGITPTVDGAKLCQDTVALLYGRIAALEARVAALEAALRAADWALLHCEQLDDQSIYQARLEIAAALVAAPGGGEGEG